jgi:hypothetical protein
MRAARPAPVESRVASAARNVQAIRISYDRVRGARGARQEIHEHKEKEEPDFKAPGALNAALANEISCPIP